MKRIDTVALTGRGRMMMEEAIEDGGGQQVLDECRRDLAFVKVLIRWVLYSDVRERGGCIIKKEQWALAWRRWKG